MSKLIPLRVLLLLSGYLIALVLAGTSTTPGTAVINGVSAIVFFMLHENFCLRDELWQIQTTLRTLEFKAGATNPYLCPPSRN